MALYWAEYQKNATVVISTLLIISDENILRDEDVTYATNDLDNVQAVLYDGMVHDFFITEVACRALNDFTQKVNAPIKQHIHHCS